MPSSKSQQFSRPRQQKRSRRHFLLPRLLLVVVASVWIGRVEGRFVGYRVAPPSPSNSSSSSSTSSTSSTSSSTTSCVDNMTHIQDAEMVLVPDDIGTPRVYILCPHTTYETVRIDKQGFVVKGSGMFAIFVRSNATVQCGPDGNPSDACVIQGGAFGMQSYYSVVLDQPFGPVLANVTIRGVTFRDFEQRAIDVQDYVGDLTFRDCIFEQNSKTRNIIIMGRTVYDAANQRTICNSDVRSDDFVITFDGCIFRDNTVKVGPSILIDSLALVYAQCHTQTFHFKNNLFYNNDLSVDARVAQSTLIHVSRGTGLTLENNCFVDNVLVGEGPVVWDILSTVRETTTIPSSAVRDPQPATTTEVDEATMIDESITLLNNYVRDSVASGASCDLVSIGLGNPPVAGCRPADAAMCGLRLSGPDGMLATGGGGGGDAAGDDHDDNPPIPTSGVASSSSRLSSWSSSPPPISPPSPSPRQSKRISQAFLMIRTIPLSVIMASASVGFISLSSQLLG